MYARMHPCIYTGMHICMHACIAYIHARVRAYMHICMHLCRNVCLPARMHANVHPCIYACMHIRIHACAHVYIHGFMHGSMHAHNCIYIYTPEWNYKGSLRTYSVSTSVRLCFHAAVPWTFIADARIAENVVMWNASKQAMILQRDVFISNAAM